MTNSDWNTGQWWADFPYTRQKGGPIMTMKQGFEQPGRTADQADPTTPLGHSNPKLDTGAHRSAPGCSRSFVHRILLVILVLLAPSLCWAQNGDLTDLSLEELLNTRLAATSVMGIHHTHTKGEWMLSFSQMSMRKRGWPTMELPASRNGSVTARATPYQLGLANVPEFLT